MNHTHITVSAADAGCRLDVLLARQGILPTRASIQRLIESGHVSVNSSPSKSSHRLKSGDVIELDLSGIHQESREILEPWDQSIEILFEDEFILVAAKPAGLVTHPGAGNRNRTLVNAMIVLRPEIARIGHELRPGIVHRLDRETSGAILFAKTETAYHTLCRMFKDHLIEKHYRALSFGLWNVKEGRIEKALGRDARDRKKISVRARKSRSAISLFRVLKQGGCAALLDVQILTGRTHQIRVHLSSENHPIVGDSKYGGGNWSRIPHVELRNRLKQAQFFGLHAYSLSFLHPMTGTPVHVEAPLPAIWSDALRILETGS